jgi:hypothetical protein
VAASTANEASGAGVGVGVGVGARARAGAGAGAGARLPAGHPRSEERTNRRKQQQQQQQQQEEGGVKKGGGTGCVPLTSAAASNPSLDATEGEGEQSHPVTNLHSRLTELFWAVCNRFGGRQQFVLKGMMEVAYRPVRRCRVLLTSAVCAQKA